MKLRDISPGKEVLLAAIGMLPLPGTPDERRRQALRISQSEVIAYQTELMTAAIQGAYDTHCLVWGGPDVLSDANADDWHEQLDTAVEEALEPMKEATGLNWFGEKTVDTRVHEEGVIAELAKSCASAMWENLSFDLSPAKILSAISITKSDLDELEAKGPTLSENEASEMLVGAFTEMQEALQLCGFEHSDADLLDAIEMASDSDELLASGAIERLGGDASHYTALRSFRVTTGGGAVETMIGIWRALEQDRHAFDDTLALPPIPAELDRSAEAEAPAPTPGPEEPVAAPEAEGAPVSTTDVPPEALRLLRAHANVIDREVAEQLGMSRASFNNRANGKGAPISDPEHVEVLRGIITEHYQGLYNALQLLPATA